MGNKLAETATGAVVVTIAIAVLYFVFATAEVETVQGYDVKAVFASVGGLRPGSDVRISGIKVGTVKQRISDPESYRAESTCAMKNSSVFQAESRHG